MSHLAFEALKMEMKELRSEVKVKQGGLSPRVYKIFDSGQEFIKQQEQGLVIQRQLIQRLFKITEKLAQKEIESDPKGFVIREALAKQSIALQQNLHITTRNQIDEDMFFDACEEIHPMTESEMKRLNTESIISHLKSTIDEANKKDSLNDEQFNSVIDKIQEMSFTQSPTDIVRASRRAMSIQLENQIEFDQDDDPIERDELPWLKDPNAKLSIWTVIKDSIGSGDISKMSVPVYFNAPVSLL
jgi:hypothetical protein